MKYVQKETYAKWQDVCSFDKLSAVIGPLVGLRRPHLTDVSGANGFTFLVDDAYVVKIPMTGNGIDKLKKELMLSTILNRKIEGYDAHMHLSQLTFEEVHGSYKTVPVLVAEKLKGKVLTVPELREQSKTYQNNFFFSLGRCLSALHHMDCSGVRLPSFIDRELKPATGLYAQRLAPDLRDSFFKKVYADIFGSAAYDVLCHNDVCLSNILVDTQKGNVCHLIDFGECVKAPAIFDYWHIENDPSFKQYVSIFLQGYQSYKELLFDPQESQRISFKAQNIGHSVARIWCEMKQRS